MKYIIAYNGITSQQRLRPNEMFATLLRFLSDALVRIVEWCYGEKYPRTISFISRGSTAEVWAARYDNDIVALKLYNKRSSHRAEREVEVSARLDPRLFVVPRMIVSTFDGAPCAVMELMDTSIIDMITDGYFFTISDIRKTTKRIMQGLASMHGIGLMHRDIKPDNILVARSCDLDTVKIGDMGYVTTLNNSDNSVAGTLQYAAPEIVRRMFFDRSCCGPPVDIWSTGMTMYAMFYGDLPFSTSDRNNMLMSIMYEPPCVDGMPRDMADLVLRCLDKNPSRRPSALDALMHPFITPPPGLPGPSTSVQ